MYAVFDFIVDLEKCWDLTDTFPIFKILSTIFFLIHNFYLRCNYFRLLVQGTDILFIIDLF